VNTILSEKADKFRLVCTFTTDGHATVTAGPVLTRELAASWFDDQLTKTDRGALRYGPHTGHKVRVMSDAEWQRIRLVLSEVTR
jgi:hypothetical protein